MEKLMDKMVLPEDIKKLSLEELNILSEEIREFLIQSVSQTGGHLAPNLGVVELTLSLWHTFDFERDKIVWDVGHQSYVYKILTGRKDNFNKLRQFKGMSGFPKRNESKYDYFDTGHSSTSISAALGMARGRDIKGDNYKVIAVIGDGALTGGMTFEALNDVGYNKTDMIIILNDNGMSISNNVGGVSSHLNSLRLQPGYNKLKFDVQSTLNTTNVGKSIASSLHKIKDSIKQLVVPSMLYEEMGIKYVGPIDGHDIKTMNEVLKKVKNIKGPVIIHTITKKGKGYELAEKSPAKFHGVAPFDLESGEVKSGGSTNYSKAFGNALVSLARKDEDIVAITAAMPDGTGLDKFKECFPKRFFDVGIAEQHAVTLAGGMSVTGLKPVFAVYSTFLQRAFDQILHDICIQNLPVVFAIDRAGIVGEDGETHQGIFDISYLSMIPNITIMAPKTIEEIKPMLEYAFSLKAPVAIRYPRGGDILEKIKPINSFKLGKWEYVKESDSNIYVIATGKMVQHSILASNLLEKENININIINAAFIKPIDMDIIKELASKNCNIFTVEDGVVKGGLGEEILTSLIKEGYRGEILNLGYGDEFIPQGDINSLYKEYKLNPNSIAKIIKDKVRGGEHGR